MGKPFARELEKIESTLIWGFSQDCSKIKFDIIGNSLDRAMYIVGSGGSLSACYYAVLLYQQYGFMAKAITPLELFYSKRSLRNSNVLFISASGRNNDILFGYKTAVGCEPKNIYSICMRADTPLAKLSNENSISSHYEFILPAGKDGFLATNSLVAFFSILYKSLGNKYEENIGVIERDNSFIDDLSEFMTKVNKDFTFSIIYAGWGQPVAMDIESKMAEAALGDVLLSDVRNFGHGRHHWFDKRKSNSAIIALITPEEEKITEKTLSLLPADIPVLKIRSKFDDGMSSIDMLIKSFHFVDALGKSQNIDPGKPGVPDFGSKLYHLKYANFYRNGKDAVSEDMKMAILRKANVPTFDSLESEEKSYWTDAYVNFKSKITDASFNSIIFDFDGTLCSAQNRYNGIDDEIATYLNHILSNGISIGIATGRGKSVRENLQKHLSEKYWKQVFIGYYNCSDIATLDESNVPNKNKDVSPILNEIYQKILSYKFPITISPELKPNQIVIQVKDKLEWGKVRVSIIQFIINLSLPNIQILESSHSIDIVEQHHTSKLSILNCFRDSDNSVLTKSLCIGDKGRWPGNDYQLLAQEYSLSVDEVSSLKDSCWNLSKPGMKNIETTKFYLSCIKFKDGLFKLDI